MRYFLYDKLVRDKIVPKMHEEHQFPFGVRMLEDNEYRKTLAQKIIEEARELLSASTVDDQKNELIDVIELVETLKHALNLDDDDVHTRLQKKREKNGGFDTKTYVHHLGLNDDDPWVPYYSEKPEKSSELTEDEHNAYIKRTA